MQKALFSRVDDASLAFFRIAFGAVIAWEMTVYLAKGWAITHYLPQVHFPFWPFANLEPLGPWGMRAVFAVTGVAAVYYALGAFQRWAASVMFVGLTYIFVLEKTYYLNHWYLACLLAFLCAVFPPTTTWAVTRSQDASKTVAAWPLYVLRAQLAIVYIFAGIAKMNPDWIRGIPLRGWLISNADLPVVGPLLEIPETAIAMAWAGMLLDFLGPFGLLWRRTRLVTFALFVGFHLTNSRLFDIGMFPWFALVATTIFFEPSWPRELVDCVRQGRHQTAILSAAAVGGLVAAVVPRDFGVGPVLVGAAIGACLAFHFATRRAARPAPDESLAVTTPPRTNRVVTAFVVGWLLLQVAVPLRHAFIPGDVTWTEEGHRFSWRMMLRYKSGTLSYRVVDRGTGDEFVVPPDIFLTDRQLDETSTRPDMIVQFAHWLEGLYQRKRGPGPYAIYADTETSLNFRPKKPLIDPTTDLTQVSWPWWPPAPWITSAPPRTPEAADTVYTNGRIYTVDDAQPWAEAVAIKDGKFLVVGSNADVEPVTGDATEVVDLGGHMAMPGLIDVHVHPLSVAENWANVKIENPGNADAILEQLRSYVEANPDVAMIRGEAWNLGVFPDDSPRKELLDNIVADRPVYLVSQTGHSAWVNSKALEMAGITKETRATGKIVFDTDPDTGEPSGTVREFALGLVERILAPTPTEQFASSLQAIMGDFNAYGFTALKPAEGTRSWMEGAANLESQDRLTMRLFPAWHWHTSISLPSTNEEADQLISRWGEFESPLVYPRYVKIFYDTSPDSYTALLLEDYVGRPGFKGHRNLPKQEFLEAITKFNANGVGVLVHVLGDGGAREVVDIFTEVRERNGDNGVLMHFSHAWMAHPEDIQRLSKVNGTCIDFSPALNYPAPEIIGSMVPPLGEERYQKFFNAKSAFETGMPVAFGSDWASALIPEPNGFHQMQSWITRQDPQNPSSGTLNADQAITLEQAVRGFTMGGAECLGFGWRDKIGSIEKGKLADFIVLDRNIFETPIAELYQTRVVRTVLGGGVVYESQ